MKKTVLALLTIATGALALSGCGSPSVTHGISQHTTNRPVTPSVRTSLLKDGAKEHGLPASDYTGLVKGQTYYAYYPPTHTYYAAAGLVPSKHSMKAEIAAQDDGGYNLFIRSSTAKKWTVYNDGLGGTEGAICPLKIPPPVLHVWGWTKKCSSPDGP